MSTAPFTTDMDLTQLKDSLLATGLRTPEQLEKMQKSEMVEALNQLNESLREIQQLLSAQQPTFAALEQSQSQMTNLQIPYTPSVPMNTFTEIKAAAAGKLAPERKTTKSGLLPKNSKSTVSETLQNNAHHHGTSTNASSAATASNGGSGGMSHHTNNNNGSGGNHETKKAEHHKQEERINASSDHTTNNNNTGGGDRNEQILQTIAAKNEKLKMDIIHKCAGQPSLVEKKKILSEQKKVYCLWFEQYIDSVMIAHCGSYSDLALDGTRRGYSEESLSKLCATLIKGIYLKVHLPIIKKQDSELSLLTEAKQAKLKSYVLQLFVCYTNFLDFAQKLSPASTEQERSQLYNDCLHRIEAGNFNQSAQKMLLKSLNSYSVNKSKTKRPAKKKADGDNNTRPRKKQRTEEKKHVKSKKLKRQQEEEMEHEQEEEEEEEQEEEQEQEAD
jgi:hypothetical protein